ncbi:MAG: hypothetical protein MJ252_05590 [archaeon]|nr:hypothetical protein [archaeon]
MYSTPSKYNKFDDGKAIPMVNYDPSIGKFIINEEAVNIISKQAAPIGIISVAGMYRTGKSYLLNRMLLNRNKAFSVGPSINPCTKGLWMWNKPVPAHTPDGQPINVFIIDTEGIGSCEVDQNHDNKIMTLAILLSSYFIFNSLGTIDENAIQNLSFIVNITKNIQTKNDTADFSMYLPSFMWVIRDFVLQLKNANGEPITSKEYLEKSLELQNGTSEFIKSKNQIRTMVKEYFKDRNCVTLVRPLTEEGNLQNLDSMEPSKLRREFLDQVSALRKIVLNSIRPKKMNGNILTGDMFIELVKNYVSKINEGAVPVIQSAWSLMCSNENAKTVEKAKENFSKKMKEIESKLPLSSNELNLLYKQYKESAINYVKENSIGEVDQKAMEKLKEELKDIKAKIINKNMEISKKTTEDFLKKNYQDIENKIKDNSYQNLDEYKEDLDKFIKYFNEKCPLGPNSLLLLYEFLNEKLLDHSKIITNQNISDIENLINEGKSKLEDLNKKIEEVQTDKEKLSSDLEDKKNKLNKLIEETNSLKEHNQSESENLSKLIEEKTGQIQKLKEKLSQIESEGKTNYKDLKEKLDKAEKQKSKIEMENTKISSNFEREKVLMEQKIIFLEKNLKQLQEQRERQQSRYNGRTTLNLRASGRTEEQKAKIENCEAKVKELSKEVTTLEDNIIDIETKILQKQKKIDNEQQKLNSLKEEYESNLKALADEKKQINEEIFDLKNPTSNPEEDEETIAFNNEIEELKIKKEQMDEEYNLNEADLKSQLNKLNNELAVLKLSSEISEKKITEFKNQIQTDKVDFDKYVKVLTENNDKLLKQYEACIKETADLKQEQEKEINSINESNAAKIKELTDEKENLAKELAAAVEEKNEKINELKEKLRQTEEEILPNIKSKIAELEINIEESKEDISITKKNNKEAMDEINLDHDTRIQDLLAKTREEIEDANNKNESSINEIRKNCELEKEETEAQIQDMIAASQEELQKIEEENEAKLNEIEREKNEKIDELQMNLDDLEKMHENYVNDTEREMALKIQKIESLKNFLAEAQNSLKRIQEQNLISIKNQMERFEAEKNDLLERIKKLKEENEACNEELNSLKVSNEEKEKIFEEQNEKLNELKQSIQSEKERIEEEVKNLNKELQEKINNYNEITSHFLKEISLKDQSINFSNDKLNDLKLTLDEFKASCQMKIDAAKEEITNEFSLKITKAENDLNEINELLSQIRSQMKDLEAKFKEEKEKLTKEKEMLIEKLAELTEKKKLLTESLEKERENTQKIIVNLTNEFKLKNDMLQKENEALQSKLKKIEADYTELNAVYEKDSNLFLNKFANLEEQKKMAETELKNLKAQYDANMDELQKKILEGRERLKAIYTKSIEQREAAYNAQIANAENTFNTKYNEVNMQNKNLMIENKTLRDKIEKYENSSNDLHDIEIKLKAQLDLEKKVKTQYETINNNQDKKIEELNSRLENQRSTYLSKIEELENKLQEYEGKKNDANIENVKQKVANERNKENNVNLIQNLKEKIMELEKIKKKLLDEKKENQREKEQIKKSSRNSSLSHGSGSSGYTPRYKMNPSYAALNTVGNKENIKSMNLVNIVSEPNEKRSYGSMITEPAEKESIKYTKKLPIDKSTRLNKKYETENSYQGE